jgi:threonine aldolase
MIPISTLRGFASDNNATVHPSVMENMHRVNQGHLVGYGHDEYTRQVASMIADYLGAKAVHFLYLGTAANVLCIQHCLRSYEAVICPSGAHIDVDECGAPEHFSGNKLLVINKENGKINPDDLVPYLAYKDLDYKVQPKLVSISNPNELGLVYSPHELQAISDFCKANDWYLHVDGARISNACAYLGISIKAITADVGVDILSLGGTKNGLMGAEAVVIFNPNLAKDFIFTQKQGMQLASKMRYIAAQFEAYFTDELWLKNARHANRLAQALGKALEKYPQAELKHPVESNAVFVQLPQQWIEKLLAHFFFYVWDEDRNIVRWVCSWDSEEEDVKRLISLLDQLNND